MKKKSLIVLAGCLVVMPLLVGGATQQTSEWSGAPISMTLRDADLTGVLKSLARRSGRRLAVEIGYEIGGPVTVQLDRVPWDQALHQVARTNDIQAHLLGEFIIITPGNGEPGIVRH